MCVKINSFACNFKYCDYDTLCKLFNTNCTSFYGSPLWPLADRPLRQLNICWRKCIRKLFNIHSRTHSRFIPLLFNTSALQGQLQVRFAKFWTQCYHSINPIVQACSLLSISSGSTVSRNLHEIMSRLNINNASLLQIMPNFRFSTATKDYWLNRQCNYSQRYC